MKVLVNYNLLKKTSSTCSWKKENGILCLNTRTAHTESIECKTKTSYISFVRVFLPRLTTETCNFFVFLCSLCDGKWPRLFRLAGSVFGVYPVLTLDVLLYMPRSEISLANPKSPSLATLLFLSIKTFLAATSPWIHCGIEDISINSGTCKMTKTKTAATCKMRSWCLFYKIHEECFPKTLSLANGQRRRVTLSYTNL